MGVVSESSIRRFLMIVAVEDFGLVLLYSWKMVLWCWNERGSFLVRFILILVVGNILDAIGACLLEILIW